MEWQQAGGRGGGGTFFPLPVSRLFSAAARNVKVGPSRGPTFKFQHPERTVKLFMWAANQFSLNLSLEQASLILRNNQLHIACTQNPIPN